MDESKMYISQMTIVSDCGREIVVTTCDLGVEVFDNYEFFKLALDYIKNSYHLTLDDPWFSDVEYANYSQKPYR